MGERVGVTGRLVVALLGMAWSVTSFLVVPVLVHKGSGPVEAYTESATMLKQAWIAPRIRTADLRFRAGTQEMAFARDPSAWRRRGAVARLPLILLGEDAGRPPSQLAVAPMRRNVIDRDAL